MMHGHSQKRLNESLMYYSVVSLVIITALPIAQVFPGVIRQSMQVLSVLAFFLGSLLTVHKVRNNMALIVLIGVFLVYYFGTWAGHDMTFKQYAFNVVALFIFATYGAYLLGKKWEYEQYKLLYRVVSLIVIITAITTAIGLIRYPLAVRDLGRTAGFLSDDVRREYMIRNIGTWPHLYGTTFIAPSFLVVFKRLKKWRYLVYWGICEVMVLSSQVTYAMLLSIILAFLVLYDFRRNTKAIVICSIMLALVGIIALNLKSILAWSIRTIENAGYNTLSSKLDDLYRLLFYKQAVGDADARFSLYGMSIEAFGKHPFGGLFLAGEKGFDQLGFHSDMFDFLGYFGLIGLVFLLIIVSMYVLNLRRAGDNRRIYLLLLFFYIVIFVLNAMLFSPMVAFGVFVMPTLVVSLCRNEIKK